MNIDNKPRYLLYINEEFFGSTNDWNVVIIEKNLNPNVKIIDTWQMEETKK